MLITFYQTASKCWKCIQKIGHINFDKKQTGERSAGKPHAAFDEAGAGNVIMVAGLRPMTKVMDKPPEPKVRAPVLDPTREQLKGAVSFGWLDHPQSDFFVALNMNNWITKNSKLKRPLSTVLLIIWLFITVDVCIQNWATNRRWNLNKSFIGRRLKKLSGFYWPLQRQPD